MLQEAIDRLVSLGTETAGIQRVSIDDGGRTVYLNVGGKLQSVVLKPKRVHGVFSLEDLIRFAVDSGSEKAVVYHSDEGVTLLPDQEDHRDRVVFQLSHSPQFTRLESLSQVVPMDQKNFVRLLQHELGIDRAIVAVFRRLDWKTQIAASGEVMPGRDRLGREVNAQVAGTAELPEDLVVTVPVYSETGERESFSLRCAIEIDAATQRLALVPLPNEVEIAIDAAQASIRQRLSESLEIPIYYGQPFVCVK
jgi:hypothetical protein